jgi:hypothetical protein
MSRGERGEGEERGEREGRRGEDISDAIRIS